MPVLRSALTAAPLARGRDAPGFALVVLVIPSDTVFKRDRRRGYVAGLVGMFAFGAFLAATLLGFHTRFGTGTRSGGVLCLLWLSVLVSYVLMDRRILTGAQIACRRTAADAARRHHRRGARRRRVPRRWLTFGGSCAH